MARYFFDPESYALNTTLTDLGFVSLEADSELTVLERSPGVKWWEAVSADFVFASYYVYDDAPTTTSTDVLMIQDFGTSSESGIWNIIGGGAGLASPNEYIGALPSTQNLQVEPATFGGTSVTSTTTQTAITVNNTLATALRVNLTGTTLRARYWQAAVGTLEANEPGTWDYEAEVSFTSPTKPALYTYASTGFRTAVTGIGVATNGDSAPFAPVPPPIIATPTNLNTQNITSNSALLDWD